MQNKYPGLCHAFGKPVAAGAGHYVGGRGRVRGRRTFGAVWCAHGKGDYEALALRIAGAAAPGTLRALVVDDTASELIRARALGAYVRVAQGVERARALELAGTLANRENASTDLRVAALRSLARFAPEQARRSAVTAAQSGDPVVQAVARTVRSK